MNSISTYAFKLFEALDERLERIEVLLGRLADAKDDRETAVELTAEVNKGSADLKAATPPGAA